MRHDMRNSLLDKNSNLDYNHSLSQRFNRNKEEEQYSLSSSDRERENQLILNNFEVKENNFQNTVFNNPTNANFCEEQNLLSQDSHIIKPKKAEEETQNLEELENIDVEEREHIYALMYSILVAECGDRSQISSILLATVYNFSGVMIGTTIALIITIMLAVFLGNIISKHISEKSLNYLAALIFLGFGIEIFLSKIGFYK